MRPFPQYRVLIETRTKSVSEEQSGQVCPTPSFFLEWRFSWFMDPVIRNLSAVIDTEPYGFQRVSILGLITSTVGLGADIMSWVR